MNNKIKNIDGTDKNMLYFLRLKLHSYSDKEICKFLKISTRELNKLEQRITFKLKSKNFGSAIVKAFELELLNKYDFVDTIVKENALKYANVIFEVSNQNNSSFYVDTLKECIIEFYDTCEDGFLKNDNYKLSHLERSFLEMKFDGYNIEYLKKELKISEQEQKGIRDLLSKKFNENVWFNIFKKAFQIKVLKKEDYLSLDIYMESLETATKISDILELKSDTNEKLLLIYYELIYFYNKIEFDCLSKYREA